MITLACEASKPRVSPIWRKETKVLKAGPKYELLHTGKSLGLIIKDVTKEDAGDYSCDLGTEVSHAKVTVRGWYCKTHFYSFCPHVYGYFFSIATNSSSLSQI